MKDSIADQRRSTATARPDSRPSGTLMTMTGPEHYQKAEQLLDRGGVDEVAKAQAHATLALAAATALNDAEEGMSQNQHHAWVTVADRSRAATQA